MRNVTVPTLQLSILCVVGLLFAACNSEILERQAEQIRQQEIEISRQRKELEALAAGQQIQDEKQKDCVRAFRDYFDKAQLTTDREEAISLYREGLAICPDDDVAHYELGRALLNAGRPAEAAKAFEAALKINPAFADAKRELDAIGKRR
jgi:tetratricopeptide (TPR) repeat protein